MAQLKDLIVNGPSRFIGDVYATTFTGNLAGNASTATNATNAGMIAGLSVHSGRNNEANKIVRTDGNGYLQVGYINSSSGHEKNASNPTYVWGSNSSDSYLRSYQTSSLSVKYATSSGSCSGNAATATKASYLDTGGMALYANNNNEINFGGTNTSSIIFFGYRATGSKPIPTSFIFGGSGGTATLTAGGFKKKDSSASYVLTGDGGHAAISSLSVNYANSSGSCSGNAATATNASSARDADKLDGYHLSQITPVVTKRDFTNGTLVKTNISFPGTNTNVSEPFLLTVKGNGYGDGIINFEFQGYVYYASSYAHPQIINSDFIIYSPNSIDKIYTMSIDNKLCFWWARQSYWQGFHIFCTTSTQSYQNRVIEVQDVSKPSGLFEQIYTPKLSLTTSNYTSYTVAKTGGGATGTWNISISGNAATATNADTLDGYHASYANSKPWGTIPVITDGGYMDVGKHFEFHYDNTTGSDYSTVLACTGNHRNIVNLPSKSGTLALLTDNVASASKWSTARTITLTGSVTGSVSIDGSANVSLATTTNHTHNYAGSSSAGGSANSALTLLYNNILDTNYGNYAVFQQFAGLSDFPHSGWFNSIKMLHNNSSGYFTEIAMSFTDEDGMWRRALRGGTQVGWYKMLDSGNYNSYAPKLDGTGASGTWGINISGNAATATNADKLDGVHYQNILERQCSGSGSSGTATGWFRIAETLINNGGGVTFLLAIQRTFHYTNNESYLFSISVSFGGGISITQLSGYANIRLITKIRVDWANSQIAYIDLYIDTSYTTNNYYWYTVGCAKSYTTWTANPTLAGNAYEFTTVQGCKSDRGFTGDIVGNASSATKLQNSRTIWGHNFDGTGNVSGALSGVTTINSTLYIDLSGNIGIGTASPSYKLYVNGDGYFTENIITESDFKSLGDAIIDGYVGIGTQKPAYRLDVNGTISCTKLLQTSDIKYKTNIKQIEYEEALKIIENLNPVTWDWNENTVEIGSSSGFVAQEAEEFIPNAISRDNENNLSLDYTQLHSYEIKVIQEQQKEIIKLKEKLKILEKLIS